MRLKVLSASDNALTRMAAAVSVVLLAFVGACGIQVWPDRESAVVEGVRVDRVRAMPEGSRFILRDSLTSILLEGYHAGYLCSEILEIGLDSGLTGNGRPTFGPRTRVRLPEAPDCPADTGGRDTVLTRVFGSGADTVWFANSSGDITDTAAVVSGRVSYDTVRGVPKGVVQSFEAGRWTYLDSAIQGKILYSDSLNSCELPEWAVDSRPADYAPGDTVEIRIALITLDSAESPDACAGIRRDSLRVSASPLRGY